MFGKSRQAFYEKNWYALRRYNDEQVILELLQQLQREIPVQSTRAIYLMIKPTLIKHGITIGRDSIHELRKQHKLLYKPRRKYHNTTNSYHRFHKYPNLIKDLLVTSIEQVWVSDITYIRVNTEFNFLSLITDIYSHKIVGYCLYPTLSAEGPLSALRMAIATLTSSNPSSLIHHSDRGIQYCCEVYIEELCTFGILSSMTENGNCYENAIAERLNGILKRNFGLESTFESSAVAEYKVHQAVKAYNNLRPHQSVSMLTPALAHEYQGELKKVWKPKVYKPRLS